MTRLERITSSDNRRLVNARKTRDGKIADKIFIEGRRLVREAIRSGIEVEECFVSDDFASSKAGRQLLSALDMVASIAQVSNRLFASLADTDHAQGIIVTAQRPAPGKAMIETRLRSKRKLVVFLSEVNNPSNLGAILRTAEAADVTGVVVSENSADVFSPKALRAAMGSSFRLPVWQKAAFGDVMAWAADLKLRTTLADTNATMSYIDLDWTLPRLLIFGSEAHGLGQLESAAIEEKIRVPMANDVESLNLAVSAGILLFEARRQGTR